MADLPWVYHSQIGNIHGYLQQDGRLDSDFWDIADFFHGYGEAWEGPNQPFRSAWLADDGVWRSYCKQIRVEAQSIVDYPNLK